MTAYGISPVGANGVERDREQRIDIPTRYELQLENERLKALLAETREAREAWHTAWKTAVDSRIATQERLSRSMRVLASLARLSPRMADVVAAAGREIYQLDRTDRLRQAKATRRARKIWRLDGGT